MSQTTAYFDIVGKWKVVGGEINTPKPPTKTMVKQIKDFKEMFFHSVFIFQADHYFNFNIAISEMKIQKGHWKYNENKNRYVIQDWKDKDKINSDLMDIEVKRDGDKTYFVLPTDDELPGFSIKLEVVKMIE
jgi:hypothetical protein